jgi:hypothetical protein
MKTAAATLLALCLVGSLARSDEAGKKQDSDSPVGTWKHAGGAELKITEKRLFWTCPPQLRGQKVPTKSFDADYAVLKNSIIVGYITQVEGGNPPFEDAPFSFRFRVDDNVLTIKEVKGLAFPTPGVTDLGAAIQGKYTRPDEPKKEEPRREEPKKEEPRREEPKKPK